MTALRHRAIAAAASMISASRADRWLAPLVRGAGLALTLHRVRPAEPTRFAPNGALQVSPEFLRSLIHTFGKAGYEFIEIDAALLRLQPGGMRRRPFAVLTFDDGYRDNVEFAAPILKGEGVPWALFAVTDYLSGRGRLWWLELEAVLSRVDRLALDIDGRPVRIACGGMADKYRAFAWLSQRFHALGEAERRALLQQIAMQADYDWSDVVGSHCLTWSELREACDAHDITIGSHTSSHAILPRCRDDKVRAQLSDSRRLLEAGLHRRILHLAYPHGRAGHGGRGAAREAGYAAALTTMPAHLSADWYAHARFGLPRISLNGLHANAAMLRAILSGLPLSAAFLTGRRRRSSGLIISD